MGLFDRKPKKTDTENTESTNSASVKGGQMEIPDPLEYYKEQNEALKQRLFVDVLGCKSKAAFEDDIIMYEEKRPYMIIALTVNIERVNKKFGRKRGDEALKAVADIFGKYFEDFYRIGGEKFNILGTDEKKLSANMNLANVELAKYLIAGKLDIDIYYGACRTNEPDLAGLSYKELLPVVLDRMYMDRAKKKPASSAVQEAEIETKQLEKTLEKRSEIKKKLEEQEAWEEKKDAESEMKSISENLGSFFDEMAGVHEENQKSKATLEEIKKEEEALEAGHIPGFPFESDALMESIKRKHMDTMWFHMTTIEITDGKDYHKLRIKVYPLNYLAPPLTLESLVIAEDVDADKRYIYKGTNVTVGVANTEFYVNSRFQFGSSQTEAEFKVSVTHRNDNYKVVKREDNVHRGVCTPYHFGKTFFDLELFPIKKNIDGLADSVIVYPDGRIEENNGNIKHGDKRFQVVLNGKYYEIVEI